MEKIRVFLEVFFFLLLTLFIYFLLITTLPVFQNPHGWLVGYDAFGVSKSSFFRYLLFSSAMAFVLLGSILIQWVPVLTPGVMANLWGSAFFFLWIDPVFALSLESQSFKYVVLFGIEIGFIYLYFFILYFLNVQDSQLPPSGHWRAWLVSHWLSGWMGFYFGLSGLLAWESLQHYEDSFRLPLAYGALLLCFLFYLLSLFLRKAEGKEVDRFSKIGRWVFIFGLVVLLAVWIGGKWRG